MKTTDVGYINKNNQKNLAEHLWKKWVQHTVFLLA